MTTRRGLVKPCSIRVRVTPLGVSNRLTLDAKIYDNVFTPNNSCRNDLGTLQTSKLSDRCDRGDAIGCTAWHRDLFLQFRSSNTGSVFRRPHKRQRKGPPPFLAGKLFPDK